ncbi:MAG TPA: hypothetical protein VE623_07725 [Acidimicrobiales bacterium]|jgi:hypothetical protein|nr:hypothetical protein [Acidimicrobiales bacterium]
MPDRYEDGIRALHDIEPPDQWDDIRRRATRGLIVPLDGDRPERRFRWPTLLAAAAVLVLVVGAAALLLRDGDDVTTNPSDPGLTPPIGGPDESSTTTQPEATTEQPSTTQSTTTQPSTSVVPIGQLPACPVDLRLTTSTAPAGWDVTMTPRDAALPADPPAGVDDRLAGVFEGPTTADNVFVFAGLPGLQDDVFEPTPGPLPGSDALIAPWEGGWYLELGIPHPAGECSITLQAIGMTNDEARQFVQGLEGS